MTEKITAMNELIDITPEDSIVPVYLIPLTLKEVQEENQAAMKFAQEQSDKKMIQQKKEEAKQLAIQKLINLGLTEEEAMAMTSSD